MPRIFVSIGSNIDKEKNIRCAIQFLRTHYSPLLISPIYESDAVGFDGEPFYNLVVGFSTTEPLDDVAMRMLQIEKRLGRKRGIDRFGPRTLDLDILLYGDLVRRDALFNIPRPDIMQYAFVLGPLAEIAPEETHPELARSFRDLWKNFTHDCAALRPVDLGLDTAVYCQ